jgi:hypothetical protein
MESHGLLLHIAPSEVVRVTFSLPFHFEVVQNYLTYLPRYLLYLEVTSFCCTSQVIPVTFFLLSRLRGCQVTSIPACRDAPYNKIKYRHFEFKRLKTCERVKISIYFYFSYII